MHLAITEGRFLNNHDPYDQMVSNAADKDSIWARIRRGLLTAIGCGCLILGVVLVITMVRPETLQSLGTAELSTIVGLIAMPVLTMLSLKYDQTVVKSATSVIYQQSKTQTRVAHSAHDRGSRAAHHARITDLGDSAAKSNQDAQTHHTQDAA